jgi:hypothetical protein
MQAGGDDNTLEGDFIRRGIEAELLEQVRSQTFRLRGEFGNERVKIYNNDHFKSFQIISDHSRS